MSSKVGKRKRDESEERPKKLKMGNIKAKSKAKVKKEIKSEEEKEEENKISLNEIVDNDEIKLKNEPSNFEHQWQDHVLLSEWNNLSENIAKNLVNLFEEGNTIPFIARYRKNITGNMSVEDLKDARDKYEEISTIKEKARIVIKSLEKQGQLNEKIRNTILSATSTEEIDYIYAPYKPENKKTLAARAIALGLEDVAVSMMRNDNVDLYLRIKRDVEGLQDLAAVEKSVMHIVSHLIATDTEVLTFIRKMKSETNFPIETKKSTTKSDTKHRQKNEANKDVDETKYENYFEFKSSTKHIKHHQVLAINRGEAQKFLSVKIIVPEYILNKLKSFCFNKWVKPYKFNEKRKNLIDNAVMDSYTRLIQPLIIRETRSELKSNAEKASIDVFVKNLKQLLLMPPVKGELILGIDPGFTNGCKIALISVTGNIIKSDIIYPHTNKDLKKVKSSETLKSILLQYKCSLIAIGNGTACRQTETWISDMISSKSFHPLDVRYTIVNESGASIYSCSTEPKKEFADLDPNIISAVSLARRIQEPLAELVKVEPKHLGIGMYQHDLTKKRLESALDEVVSECVSFVGVDLNTTSQCLLRRVAGLTDKKATDIICYREKNGYFKSREEILKVSRIGKRIYEQCVGFLRVGPINKHEAFNFYTISGTNKLDCTDIHPESYKVVNKLLKKMKLKSIDIGTDEFIRDFNERNVLLEIDDVCKELKTEIETLKLITDSLTKPLNYDLRWELSQTPLFKKGLTSITDLNVGAILTGRVENCTHFGCFVDIGVGCNGLLHTSHFKGMTFNIGDQVEVKILNVDVIRKRIGLEALRKL